MKKALKVPAWEFPEDQAVWEQIQQRIQENPSYQRLEKILLRYGGLGLFAPLRPQDDPNIERVMREGLPMELPVSMKTMDLREVLKGALPESSEMEPSGLCHYNAAFMWLTQQEDIQAIGTGYALVDSDLWTQHSWGISAAPDILETTDYPCKRYFGLRLEGADADEFVKLVLAPHGDLLFSASPRGRMVGITREQADQKMRKMMDRAITEKKGPAMKLALEEGQ